MKPKAYLFYFQSQSGWFDFGIRWPLAWRFPTTGEYIYAAFLAGLLLGICL